MLCKGFAAMTSQGCGVAVVENSACLFSNINENCKSWSVVGRVSSLKSKQRFKNSTNESGIDQVAPLWVGYRHLKCKTSAPLPYQYPFDDHGGLPVNMFNTVPPTLHISAFLPYFLLSNQFRCHEKYGVPRNSNSSFLEILWPLVNCRAAPKSANLTVPKSFINTFPGFISK